MPEQALLIPQESREMTRQPNMMELLQLAISKESAIDVIERLAAMQREARDHQAMVDFNDALQRCQDGLQPVRANMDNSQTNSKYANYVALDRAIRPIYSREGFSLSFSTEEATTPETVLVVCTVAKGGYSRQYRIPMATDGKGAKGGSVMTRTHAIGAASSYGMRYLLKMIFNLAIGEHDDDGNCDGEMSPESRKLAAAMEKAGSPEELTALYRAAVKDALKARDYKAIPEFDKIRDRRHEEILNAA